jgi:CCDC81-like prokaryotic HU domain 2
MISIVSDMFDLLHYYFIQNRTLSLPGIGTFELFRVSAQTDFTNKKILAPTYTISFDKMNDTPDKEMFQYISSRKNISEWEAMKLVNDLAHELKQQLRSGQEVEWKGIGILKPDSSGDIIFQPDRLKYDFIPHVDAERVIRVDANHRMLVGDHEVSKTEMEQFLQEENVVVKEKPKWWVYAILVAAIALILIFLKLISSDSPFTGGKTKRITPESAPSTYRLIQ